MQPSAITIHTVETPAWLVALIDALKEAMHPLGFIGPLGCRWWEPDHPTALSHEAWTVIIFPTPNEALGGPNDGCKFVSGFRLDISRILSFFHHAEDVAWNAPTQYNGDLDGPEISIKGLFLGRPVWLRIFSIPPPDEPVSFLVDYATGELTEKPEGG